MAKTYLLAAAAVLALAACESTQPATRAGAALDRAGTNTGQALDRAADSTGQALDRAAVSTGDAMSRAGTWVRDQGTPAPATPAPR